MVKILVIEDDPYLLKDLQFFLTKQGFDAQIAENGHDGIQSALNDRPDLILCDIMMPEVDGYEVLTELRNHTHTASIPFIFLTALASLDDIRQGMDLGADDYLTKPFKYTDILKTIQARLSRNYQLETQRLRDHAYRLVSIQESERQKIAQQLEQGIVQSLAGLRMNLSIAKRLPANALAELMNDMETSLTTITNELSVLVDRLHPTMIDQLRVLPLFLWLVEEIKTNYDMEIDFHHTGLNGDLEKPIKQGSFRILQDLLMLVVTLDVQSVVQLRVIRRDTTLSMSLNCEINNPHATALSDIPEVLLIQERTVSLAGDARINTIENTLNIDIEIPLDAAQIVAEAQPFKLDNMPMVNSGHVATIPDSEYPADSKIKVQVIDNNPIVLQGVLHILRQVPQLSIQHNTLDDLEDMDNLECDCDVVVFNPANSHDIPLSDVIERLLELTHDKMLVAFASSTDTSYVVEAFHHGISGYVPHIAPPDDLINAIRYVLEGDMYLSESISRDDVDTFLNANREDSDLLERLNSLTNREQEIFKLIAEGNTNSAIAHELVISVRTVEAHRYNLMRKLDVVNHADLVKAAMRYGVIT